MCTLLYTQHASVTKSVISLIYKINNVMHKCKIENYGVPKYSNEIEWFKEVGLEDIFDSWTEVYLSVLILGRKLRGIPRKG